MLRRHFHMVLRPMWLRVAVHEMLQQRGERLSRAARFRRLLLLLGHRLSKSQRRAEPSGQRWFSDCLYRFLRARLRFARRFRGLLSAEGLPANRLALERTERKLLAHDLVRLLVSEGEDLARTKES